MSSPAERALITAKGYAARLGISSDQIEQQEDLYHASTSSIRRIISNTNNKINALMLFGHNPGFTYLINDLSDFYLDNLPTCAICGIQFEIDNWSQIIHTTGKKFYYDYPKS